MNIQQAAAITRSLIPDVEPMMDDEAKELSHAAWILENLTQEFVSTEKAHRWLGYAQAIIVLRTEVNVTDLPKIDDTTAKSSTGRPGVPASNVSEFLRQLRVFAAIAIGSALIWLAIAAEWNF